MPIAPTAQSDPPRRTPYVSPLQKLAFASALLFLFLLHSRVLDLTFSFLHIPSLSLYLALLASFLGGGFFRAFTHRIGVLLVTFTIWMMMGVPFSVWPGGSAHWVEQWLKAAAVYVIIAGIISTFDQLRRAIHVLAFSILTLAILALLFGNMQTGRLVLDRGRFTNPNDLAQILLMGLPFWWYIATNKNLKKSRRRLALLAMVPILMAMSKTGSRGAMIATLAVGLVWFWRSSISHKIALAVGAMMLVTLGSIFLPQSLKDRYFTFTSADDSQPQSLRDYNMEESAVSSTESRWQLLKDSIALTVQNPVFGVGVGQYVVAQDLYSRAVRHHKGSWQVTHNTFTEVSSECGIPALIMYLLIIFYGFRAARVPNLYPRPRAGPALDEVASASFCLRLSLLSYVVAAVFASFAYQTQMLVLAGLVVAFSRTARLELHLNAKPEAAVERPFPTRRRQRMSSRARPAA